MYLSNTKQTMHLFNTKRRFILTLLTLVPLFIASCSQSVRFAVSSVVPSAEGSVKLTKDENQNKLIVLKVRNLVDPARIICLSQSLSVMVSLQPLVPVVIKL